MNNPIELSTHIDGIINSTLFEKEKLKLLFIGKEPNKKNHNVEFGETMSFVQEWNETKPTYQFAHRIAELAYGIFNNFPNHDEIAGNSDDHIKKRLEILRRISFLNIKKEAGHNTISDKELLEIVTKNKDKIINQIENIQPDIIIIFVSNESIVKKLFSEIDFSNSGFGCLFGHSPKYKVIQFYHPSVRVGSSALYSMMKVNFEKLGWSKSMEYIF